MSNNLHPEGTFTGRIVQWALADGKAAPNVFMVCRTEETNEDFHYYGGLGDSSFKHTIKAMRAGGYAGTDVIADVESADCGLDRNRVSLVIEHEQLKTAEGMGRVNEDGSPMMVARVKWINALSGGGTPLSAEKKAQFRDKLKAMALEFDAANPGVAAAAKASKAAPKTNGATSAQSGRSDLPPAGHPAHPDNKLPF